MSKLFSATRPCILALAFAGAIPSVPLLANDDARWLTPTMINARAHMFEAGLNYLTFQHMDQMFATRNVEADSDVWELQSEPVSLDGDYTILRETMPLEDALESLFTNALLVIKDGNIVY
jgi:hypothetical protein